MSCTNVNCAEIKVPTHVAFIPDGNRRWAKAHDLMLRVGHEEGFNRLDAIVREAKTLGIKYFTAYVFSTENWNRPEVEVNNLMELFECILTKYADVYEKEGVRVKILGDTSKFSPKLQKSFANIQEKTKKNDDMVLSLCLNYGARNEILQACRKIAKDVAEHRLRCEDVNDDVFKKYLYTSDIPDPDLVIRTSGEVRLSNFLLWQLAYTEFIFEDKYLPDYTIDDFYSSLKTYSKRQQRHGR